MEFGPCGGVGADGSCEVGDFRCTFLGLPLPRWTSGGPGATGAGGSHPAAAAPRRSAVPGGACGDLCPARPRAGTAAAELLDVVAERPLVVSMLPAAPLDARSIAECAAPLRGHVDAVLAGDAATSRLQFPPAYRARLIQDEGLRVWAGVNCRDRNRVALEAELAALAHAGVAAVHCVTGDHPLSGGRPDALPVFDLDSTRLVALAAEYGLLASVAESPTAPPVDLRAERVGEKAEAGASFAMLQYCGGAAQVAAFAADCPIPVLPGVPMIVDHEGAALLRSFAAAVLPEGYTETILASSDPLAAGVDVAIRHGRELLGVPGIAGVVVAGGVAAGAEPAFAEALAEVGRALMIHASAAVRSVGDRSAPEGWIGG
ncbi:methylenetetrahydrofolate reductase C-terminal domain-containing protein [Pseudonocardia xishanensis]|uniref:Methylenetetrahydrofolate reductase C-terminal domain-containing protein n=2 Tax=Pseudonocardia xishanensis TaxID=630995 RepID=A0ABP8RFL8_9PSEU